jgi:hypothetical protein
MTASGFGKHVGSTTCATNVVKKQKSRMRAHESLQSGCSRLRFCTACRVQVQCCFFLRACAGCLCLRLRLCVYVCAGARLPVCAPGAAPRQNAPGPTQLSHRTQLAPSFGAPGSDSRNETGHNESVCTDQCCGCCGCHDARSAHDVWVHTASCALGCICRQCRQQSRQAREQAAPLHWSPVCTAQRCRALGLRRCRLCWPGAGTAGWAHTGTQSCGQPCVALVCMFGTYLLPQLSPSRSATAPMHASSRYRSRAVLKLPTTSKWAGVENPAESLHDFILGEGGVGEVFTGHDVDPSHFAMQLRVWDGPLVRAHRRSMDAWMHAWMDCAATWPTAASALMADDARVLHAPR